MVMTIPNAVVRIAAAIHHAGGQAILVGGCVRDEMLGLTPKDLDIEVFGLDADALVGVLSPFGHVKQYGASFPVFGVGRLGIDFALPRAATFTEAALHRDLSINSMGIDIVTGKLLDPHGGCEDLRHKRLRATHEDHFGADPVRGLRVAQLAARLEMVPDAALIGLCSRLDLTDIPGERIYQEFRKLLLLAPAPAVGLRVLHDTGLLRHFPELADLVGVPQDPKWHPEGDVWVHTLMVVDEAARLRDGGPHDWMLMLGALLHDVGKPSTTQRAAGAITACGHDVAGEDIATAFLRRLRAPNEIQQAVAMLVRHHLAPALLPQGEAGAKAYRRLIRELREQGVEPSTLLNLARADQWGRTTPDSFTRRFPAGDAFWAHVKVLDVPQTARAVVQGRHLMAAGYAAGPALGELLRHCRDIQDETGWDDPQAIIAAAFGSAAPHGS